MFHVPEKCRLTRPNRMSGDLPSIYFTDITFGNNGIFQIDHYKITEYIFFCTASDGEGWEHVSVSLKSKNRRVDRNPTWLEMCFIKDLFWDQTDYVMQLHPPKDLNISMYEFCLHLWRPKAGISPVPHPIMVGTKDE